MIVGGEKLIALWREEKLSDRRIRAVIEKLGEDCSTMCARCEIKEACIERKLGERRCESVKK